MTKTSNKKMYPERIINVEEDIKILNYINKNKDMENKKLQTDLKIQLSKDMRVMGARIKVLKNLLKDDKKRLLEVQRENGKFFVHYKKYGEKFRIHEITRNPEKSSELKKIRKRRLNEAENSILLNKKKSKNLKQRINLFLKSLKKNDESHTRYNSEVFIKVLKHFMKNAGISRDEMLDMVRGEKELSMARLRNIICKN